MRFNRSVRFSPLALVVAVCLAWLAAGCGSSGDSTKVEVSPEFQKKTENMLNNMMSEQKAKHQADGPAKKATTRSR